MHLVRRFADQAVNEHAGVCATLCIVVHPYEILSHRERYAADSPLICVKTICAFRHAASFRFDAPVFGGGGKFDTGRDSAHS